jgi:hypothetical protein
MSSGPCAGGERSTRLVGQFRRAGRDQEPTVSENEPTRSRKRFWGLPAWGKSPGSPARLARVPAPSFGGRLGAHYGWLSHPPRRDR